MAEQPSFSRCPYCQRKLEKRPQRKSKCPHCSEVIYVRSDDLLRVDEVEQATKPKKASSGTTKKSAKKTGKGTAKKPKTGASASSGSGAKKKSARRKSKPASSLAEDLLNQAQGAFKPGDLQGGIMLIVQLLGKFLKPEQIADLLGGLIGGGNTSRNAFVGIDTDALMDEAAAVYDDLEEDDQRQLLAVLTWVQNGFQ